MSYLVFLSYHALLLYIFANPQQVILKDTLAVTKYVSNHLPFVVEIEYPKRDLNPNAVLFAGVLVFMILAISLLIPFVVRTKRRCKAGKPIFRCGSSDGSSDSDSIGKRMWCFALVRNASKCYSKGRQRKVRISTIRKLEWNEVSKPRENVILCGKREITQRTRDEGTWTSCGEAVAPFRTWGSTHCLSSTGLSFIFKTISLRSKILCLFLF